MRKTLLSLSVLAFSLTTTAQTTATFEELTLPKTDTAYINYTAPGTDVGFKSGLAYFPCVYDTSGGYQYWSSGFSYSNMRDSVTSGFMNQYSAKTAIGFASSANYVVAYGATNIVRLTDSAINKNVFGAYFTNSTYAFNSMRDGDGFSKKFTAIDSDWFRIDIFAFRKDTLSKDSVSFYLADFRNTDSTKNYIVNDWQWVDLSKLGKTDSLYFRLQSSDNGSFGMNTPAYFCMDNLITNESGLTIKNTLVNSTLKIYPNPASNVLFIESSSTATQQIYVSDFLGRKIAAYEMKSEKLEINTSNYAPGIYILTFKNGENVSSAKFVKQ